VLRINDDVFVGTEYLGCNVGCVLTERGPVLVDSPVLPQDIRSLLGELSQISIMDIAYLVYTHEHFDHVIGSAHLTKRIIAHQASVSEIARLKTDLPEEVKRYFPDIYQKYRQVFESVEIILPEIVFDGELELNMGNRTPKAHWVSTYPKIKYSSRATI
jgi:glyoxylase-like metal-dependent hydrolase (beta-lactamase superfamily II)